MTWMVAALLSAAAFGAVSVLDKRLLSRDMPSASTYYVWLGISLVFYAAIILAIWGLPRGTEGRLLLAAYGCGVSWGVGLAFLFFGLRLEEASRAIAIYHVFPVFVALLAVLFLDEVLDLGQWLAIVVIVVGAFLISIRHQWGLRALQPSKSVPVLIAASFFTAVALLAGKVALEDMPVEQVYVFRNLGMATVLLAFVRPRRLKEMASTVRNRATLVLVVFNLFILAPLSVLVTLLATDLGPVSLVSALTATRPFFVFAFTIVLSAPGLRFLEESLARDTLAFKLVAMALIVGGVAALQLL